MATTTTINTTDTTTINTTDTTTINTTDTTTTDTTTTDTTTTDTTTTIINTTTTDTTTTRAPIDIWAMCHDITSKNQWYDKIFDTDIIHKWRQEVAAATDTWNEECHGSGEDVAVTSSIKYFDLAIKLLQATAQGVKHSDNCQHDDGVNACSDCIDRLRSDILDDPDNHGYPGMSTDQITAALDQDTDWQADIDCDHPRCNCLPPHSRVEDYVQYLPQGVLEPTDHAALKAAVADLAAKTDVDYHPGSNDKVRDIVHPSMYCYVKGVTELKDGSKESPVEESERYSWLPAEFSIDNGRASISSYINNLPATLHPDMYGHIEKLVTAFVPALSTVLKRDVSNSQLQIIVKVGCINLTPDSAATLQKVEAAKVAALPPADVGRAFRWSDTAAKQQERERKMLVAKAHTSKYEGGSWHLEGMPYEHIAATCIHYVDATGITPSFLEFRKPVLLDEENLDYPQSDSVYTSHHYGVVDHYDGEMNRYLGAIRCHEGASVVFPNVIQHRVKEFELAEGEISSNRAIVALFVIDPDNRIKSSADVPAQQSMMTPEEAAAHRLRLMYHRKFYVKSLNTEVFERPFSLCEH